MLHPTARISEPQPLQQRSTHYSPNFSSLCSQSAIPVPRVYLQSNAEPYLSPWGSHMTVDVTVGAALSSLEMVSRVEWPLLSPSATVSFGAVPRNDMANIGAALGLSCRVCQLSVVFGPATILWRLSAILLVVFCKLLH